MAGETGSLACVSSDAKDRTSPGRILGRLLGGMGGLYPQSPRWRRQEISGDCTEMRKAN